MTETAKKDDGYTVVCLPPQDKPVYFVVPRVHPDSDVGEFMVDENDCPTNWLRNIQQIITDGDTDPHGLFEYVKDIPRPSFLDRSHDPEEEWRKVIPEAFPAGDSP